MSDNENDKFAQDIQPKRNQLDPVLRREYESFQEQIPRFLKNQKFELTCIAWCFVICMLSIAANFGAAFGAFFLVMFLFFMYWKNSWEFVRKAEEISAKTGLPWTTSKDLLKRYRFGSTYNQSWTRQREGWQSPRAESSSLGFFKPSSFSNEPSFSHSYESSSSNWDSSSPSSGRSSFSDSSSFSSSHDSSSSWNSPSTNPSTGLPMSSGGIDVGGNSLGCRRE